MVNSPRGWWFKMVNGGFMMSNDIDLWSLVAGTLNEAVAGWFTHADIIDRSSQAVQSGQNWGGTLRLDLLAGHWYHSTASQGLGSLGIASTRAIGYWVHLRKNLRPPKGRPFIFTRNLKQKNTFELCFCLVAWGSYAQKNRSSFGVIQSSRCCDLSPPTSTKLLTISGLTKVTPALPTFPCNVPQWGVVGWPGATSDIATGPWTNGMRCVLSICSISYVCKFVKYECVSKRLYT